MKVVVHKSDPAKISEPIRVATLDRHGIPRFQLSFDRKLVEKSASELQLIKISGLTMRGSLLPDGKTDWLLKGHLNAEVSQACVVSLAPVTTRINEKFQRRLVAEAPEYGNSEAEETILDEESEELGEFIDLHQIALEMLVLALPLYPRHPDAELNSELAIDSLPDPEEHPFSALKALKLKE